ncbi:topbp1, putative, partial [Ixodes scapularis]
LPTGKSPRDAPATLRDMYDLTCREQMEPKWITTQDCLAKSSRNPTEVFVCDPFEGPAFDHLTALNCRVVGPLCMALCIQEQQSLPRRPNPLYSLSFRGMVVTVSALSPPERQKVQTWVELMGGTYMAALTKSVTHVVAGEVGSKKYHAAASRKLPVMQPQWVKLFWEKEQHTLAHASSDAYNHLRLPAFKGLSITVSQVSPLERKELQVLVESNGGKYSGQLKGRDTTHVVLLHAGGSKYQYGQAWQLHCVHVSWLHDSARAGYALDESLYAVKPQGATKSTPSSLTEAPSFELPVDVSAIGKVDLVSCLEETRSSNVSDASRMTQRDPVDEIDVEKLSSHCGQFLDGCCVVLWGFAPEKLDKMRRVINACGGVRFNEYAEEVTHVVVAEGASVSQLNKAIAKQGGFPYLVSPQWFAESSALGAAPPRELDRTTRPDLSDIVNQYRTSDNTPANGSALQDPLTSYSAECQGIDLVPAEATGKGDKLSSGLSNLTPNALFDLMTFRIHDFKSEDEALLQEMIDHNGGKVIADITRKADGPRKLVEVVPLVVDLDKDYDQFGGVVVTYCWLQACIHAETLLGFDSDPLFSPFQKPTSEAPLHGCVISFSQYNAPEREFLIHLAESMGAVCQEFLVRKVSKQRKLLRNTHLVACEPQGSKYEAAKKWGLPVVTKEWLVASAKFCTKVNEDQFFVDSVYNETLRAKDSEASKVAPATSLSPEKGRRSTPPCAPTLNGGEYHSDSAEGMSSRVEFSDLPDQFQTPEHVQRASIDGVPTPGSYLKSQRIRELMHQSRNSSSTSIASIDGSISEDTFQQMLDGTHKPKLHLPGLPEQLEAKQKAARKGPHTLSLGKQLAQNMRLAAERIGDRDLLDGLSSTPTPKEARAPAFPLPVPDSRPLEGIVVCISKKLAQHEKELRDIVVSLGGHFAQECTEQCTHFVCQGRPGEPLPREAGRAREQGKKLVGPEWVYACKGSGARLDEADFPSVRDERLSLSGHFTAVRIPKQKSPTKEQSASSEPGLSKGWPQVDSFANAQQVTPKPTEPPSRRLTENHRIINDQLDELMSVAKEAGRRLSHHPPPRASLFNSPSIPDLPLPAPSSPTGRSAHLPLPDSESQFVGVTWDDPTRRQEMARLAGKLSEKFMLSGLAEEQKAHYAGVVEELGGVLLTSKNYDPEMTHLVLASALKNERYLAAVAAGKFVLHTAYLDDSAKAGQFLDEEGYEWGGPLTDGYRHVLFHRKQPAYAPRRWRQLISRNPDSRGAFSEWRVILFASGAAKEAVYRRVLEAGGATILPSSPPDFQTGDVTHALFDAGTARSVDLKLLTDAGVLCLKAEYMATFLVDDPAPSPGKFRISELTSLLNCEAPSR